MPGRGHIMSNGLYGLAHHDQLLFLLVHCCSSGTCDRPRGRTFDTKVLFFGSVPFIIHLVQNTTNVCLSNDWHV